MKSIFTLTEKEIRLDLQNGGHPSYRGRQIWEWLYEKSQADPQKMANLGKELRNWLASAYQWKQLEVIKTIQDPRGETIKFLLGLPDGNTLEMVIMRYLNKEHTRERNTLCLSSQIGCPVGCPFCATGQSGFTRNLQFSELMEQVFLANEYLAPMGERIDNVVFMGMGEPLLNRDAVFSAISLLRQNFVISQRRITLSTSGVPEGILAMAENAVEAGLAVSLHAGNDGLRDQLVPLNRKYPLAELLQACRDYQEITRRRITFEYILIDGMNMEAKDARELRSLLKGLSCHINGIPVNSVPGSAFKRPGRNKIREFKKHCLELGLSFSVREEKGLDIQGACGQLRNQERKPDESINP